MNDFNSTGLSTAFNSTGASLVPANNCKLDCCCGENKNFYSSGFRNLV